MSHLTNEQLEDILAGQMQQPEHLRECEFCGSRLAEKRVLANRLKTAFEGLKPPPTLCETIRHRLAAEPQVAERSKLSHIADIFIGFERFAVAASIAAVVLFVLLPFLGRMFRPSAAVASESRLVEIHRHNLSPDPNFYHEMDHAKLGSYFKEKLGFVPAMPKGCGCVRLQGCCVRQFDRQLVGTYVIDTPAGPVSIIVVKHPPEVPCMAERTVRQGYTLRHGSFKNFNFAALQIKDYTYFAVGEVADTYLVGVFEHILFDNGQ